MFNRIIARYKLYASRKTTSALIAAYRLLLEQNAAMREENAILYHEKVDAEQSLAAARAEIEWLVSWYPQPEDHSVGCAIANRFQTKLHGVIND